MIGPAHVPRTNDSPTKEAAWLKIERPAYLLSDASPSLRAAFDRLGPDNLPHNRWFLGDANAPRPGFPFARPLPIAASAFGAWCDGGLVFSQAGPLRRFFSQRRFQPPRIDSLSRETDPPRLFPDDLPGALRFRHDSWTNGTLDTCLSFSAPITHLFHPRSHRARRARPSDRFRRSASRGPRAWVSISHSSCPPPRAGGTPLSPDVLPVPTTRPHSSGGSRSGRAACRGTRGWLHFGGPLGAPARPRCGAR